MTRASPPCFKWAILSPFFIHLFLSKQNFQQIDVKKCPYSIQCWDSNSQTLEHQSSAITTRPGLLPIPSLIKVPLCLSEENKKQLMCVLFCSQIHSEQFFSSWYCSLKSRENETTELFIIFTFSVYSLLVLDHEITFLTRLEWRRYKRPNSILISVVVLGYQNNSRF